MLNAFYLSRVKTFLELFLLSSTKSINPAVRNSSIQVLNVFDTLPEYPSFLYKSPVEKFSPLSKARILSLISVLVLLFELIVIFPDLPEGIFPRNA